MSNTPSQASRLYNKELIPESATGTWKTRNLFNWWMSGWHSLGGYTMAIGLFVFGLTGWQVILAFVIGVVILYIVNNLTGVAGQREKVPFPVFARGTFGVFGANVPAVLRAVVAVFWYGIQTYLASAAVMVLILKVFPSTEALASGSFLGLSALGWICFLILSALQVAVLLSGMEAVRHLSDLAGPTIWIALLALALWMLMRAEWKPDFSLVTTAIAPSSGQQFYGIAAAAFIVVAFFAGPSLNFADFTRNAPTEASVRKGNALGLLINATAFGIISVVIALASYEVYGDATHDPIALMGDIDSVPLLLIVIIAVSLATAGINIILNYVAPVYDLINIWPKFFTFKRAGALVAVLSVIATPWNLFANPVLVNQFIGGVGALMGPLVGIVIVDYYLIQGRRLDTKALFSDDPAGPYYYNKGYNSRAILTLVAVGAVTVLITVVPAFSQAAPFTWPIGAIGAAILYYLLSKQHRRDIGAHEPVAGSEEDLPVAAGEPV